jgi:hypothetical protein
MSNDIIQPAYILQKLYSIMMLIQVCQSVKIILGNESGDGISCICVS